MRFLFGYYFPWTKIMDSDDRVLRKTGSYRILIDRDGTAHIRVVRRVSFRTLVSLCRETCLALDRSPGSAPRIVIHIPRSLFDGISENLSEFVLFGRSCTDTVFELQLVGE